MKTYPYTTPDGIIELVRKDEHDNALELLREIRDNEVNTQDEADKFLRDHQPSELSKLRADNAELLSRLNDARESHLAASARDVQTIQRQSVLLGRLATALKEMISIGCEYYDMDCGGPNGAEAVAAAESALAAYESAKSGNLPDPLVEAVKPCDWKQDEDGNWYTACYHFLSFEYSPPNEQGYKFCHHCGHHINFINYTESLV